MNHIAGQRSSRPPTGLLAFCGGGEEEGGLLDHIGVLAALPRVATGDKKQVCIAAVMAAWYPVLKLLLRPRLA